MGFMNIAVQLQAFSLLGEVASAHICTVGSRCCRVASQLMAHGLLVELYFKIVIFFFPV